MDETKTADGASPGAESKQPAAVAVGHRKVKVTMRRAVTLCGQTFDVGDVLGVVQLPPDLTLNCFVDAVRNGLATE